MADAIQILQALGLGDYEARAYAALLQHNPVTGYELAKASGIPRPNIYPILQKLEERGLALRVESDETTRYLPTPPEEFLARVDRDFGQTISAARQVLPALAQVSSQEYVWTTEGYDNLLGHARALINDAHRHLLVALWPAEARALVNDLAAAETRNVEITTLCLAACPQECGGCRGHVYRNRVVDTQDTRWLMVVPDGEEALTGEMPAQGEVSVVRTRQRLLVDMTTWFIRHSIALGALLLDAGAYLETHVQAPTRAALSAAGPRGSGGWMAYMRRLLASEGGGMPGAPSETRK